MRKIAQPRLGFIYLPLFKLSPQILDRDLGL